ncbi:MAG: DNA-deoxyinosine glycosylase [Burkholderiales bacterium]
MRDAGFPPIADRDAEILILGSLPGRRSLKARQYYAHPMNGFWRILGRVLGANFDVTYAGRKRLLKRHRIALWDVVAAARRPGSLDASIVPASIATNDFASFFKRHPRIRLVCLNGGKAAELYRRRVLPTLGSCADIRHVRLPSTSPAHAAMPFAKKLARWRAITSAARPSSARRCSPGSRPCRSSSGRRARGPGQA